MDSQRFDEVVKLMGSGASRRRILTAMMAAIGGTVIGSFSRGGARVSAGCLPEFKPCVSDDDCCGGNDVCFRGACGDPEFCGGDIDDECDIDDDCCGYLTCNSGTCQIHCPFGGEACDTTTDCCSFFGCTQNETCGPCGGDGGECGSDEDCCLGFACVEGSCAAEATGGGDHATITIHNATCPNPGSDIYANCHGNALGGVDFDFNGFEVGSGTETTNASGVATHTILEAAASGDVTISEDPDVLADYSGAYVFCSEQNSGDVLFDGPANGGSVTISAQQGDDIICDWYNLSGEASNGGDGPTTLPNTGSGSDGDDSSGIGLAALAGAAALLAAGKKVRASAAERGVDA